jgi:N-methylhydantoinase A/oxoprolinase/acetone carboxylase beta subunit
MLFVGIDVGGTFTDIIVFDNESRKTSSKPSNGIRIERNK